MREVGRLTDTSPLAEKAPTPMILSDVGRITFDRELQPRNAKLPRFWRLVGR